ncbi:hypothetical protein C8R44DRAFT_938604 [Mycena epipterygia]|nr:hypothetical protein C8R44DRAFT_938604 [Mycena epipterygia]
MNEAEAPKGWKVIVNVPQVVKEKTQPRVSFVQDYPGLFLGFCVCAASGILGQGPKYKDFQCQLYRFHVLWVRRPQVDVTYKGQALDLGERYTIFSHLTRKKKGQKQTNMKDLPNVIEIAIGMKVMVTSNIEADLDITNGAWGEIVEPPSSQGQTIPYILVVIAASPTGGLSLFNFHYPMLLAEDDGLKALNEQTERWWDEMQSCGQSREQMVEEQLQAEESAS